MTKIASGTFLATATEISVQAVMQRATQDEKKSLVGDYLLLWPYWYNVSENETLKCVGKCELTWAEIADEQQATTEQIVDDLACVLDTEFDMAIWGTYEVTMPIVHAMLPNLGTLQVPGNGMPREGDYIALIGSLYAVGRASKLKCVGTVQAETNDPAAFVKDFARLTGQIAVDMDSIERATTPDQFDAMFKRMSPREKERFLRECERMFGPSPARRTHD